MDNFPPAEPLSVTLEFDIERMRQFEWAANRQVVQQQFDWALEDTLKAIKAALGGESQ